MPPNRAARRLVAAAALVSLIAAVAVAAPPKTPEKSPVKTPDAPAAAPAPAAPPPVSPPPVASPKANNLDALRQQCIAAAAELHQRERTVDAMQHQIDLLTRDAEGRQRGLDDSRPQQANLLGTLEHIARTSPAGLALAGGNALDRMHAELLRQAMAPTLRAQAGALAADIERIAALRKEIAAQKAALAEPLDNEKKQRDAVAQLVAQRSEMTRKLLPDDPGLDARLNKLSHEASDLGDLIKLADAAAERRSKDVLDRAKTAPPPKKTKDEAKEAKEPATTGDLTRPRNLRAFDPPNSALILPVSGSISRHFAPDATVPSQALGVTASGAGEVVAPFDGRIVYAGSFRSLGLVLIIRHGGGYYSLFVGMGRIDSAVDQWVLAGEPVGAMPDTGGTLHFEMRRDGRPVDPEPWLAKADAKGDAQGAEPGGDQKVHE